MADTDWGSPRPAKEWVRYNEDSKAKSGENLKSNRTEESLSKQEEVGSGSTKQNN